MNKFNPDGKYAFFGLTAAEFFLVMFLFAGMCFISVRIFFIPFVVAGFYYFRMVCKRGAFHFLVKNNRGKS